MASSSAKTFLSDFPIFQKLPATWFLEIWDHYDADDNGFIEGKELEKFFSDLSHKMTGKFPSPNEKEEMTKKLLEKYDKAGDGRISLEEMAAILPTEESFLLLFRRNEKLRSSVTLMETWRKYDKDKTGVINADELKDFIRDLIEKTKPDSVITDEKIDEYVHSILKYFVKDNHVSLPSMAKILDTRENFLLEFEQHAKAGQTKEQVYKHFVKVFDYYDKGKTGVIEGDEVDAFVKDFFELGYSNISPEQIQLFKRGLLDHFDVNNDGVISKKELAMMLINA